MGAWITANSEAIAGFRYDERQQTLRVRFNTGSMYDYFRAPPVLVERFIRAHSKGEFFAAHIRDRLAFRRVT